MTNKTAPQKTSKKTSKAKILCFKAVLTPTFIKNLKSEKDMQITDGAISGLQLRYSHRTCKKRFYFWYRVIGSTRQRYMRLGNDELFSLDEIRAQVLDLKREVAMGKDPHMERREAARAMDERAAKQKKVKELAPIFINKHSKEHTRKSTYQLTDGYFRNHIVPIFGNTLADDINLEMLQDAYDKIKNYATISTADHVMRSMSVFLNWCEKHGYRTINTNPCRYIHKAKKPKFKPTLLDQNGYTKLLVALDDALIGDRYAPQGVLAIKALMLTGCRCSEITDLEHNELDLANGYLRLNKRKTDFFDVPLAEPAIDVIREALSVCRSRKYVFHSPKDTKRPISDLRKVFSWALERAGLPHMRIHDLRHSFATMATTIGEDIRTLKDVLGHTTINTTEIYAHVSNSAARKVANNTANAIIKTKGENDENEMF